MSLRARLLERIATQGPMSLADYMSECLLNPDYGYYATRDPLGRGGDFTTAPEISQMFGELVGLALAQAWMDQGNPAPFVLAELGPGRGTLMADALRATRAVPGFHAAARLHLVEASPVLRAEQAKLLAPYAPVWLDDVQSLPQLPLFLIGNEFFDALPIRQFVRDGELWRERLVGARAQTICLGKGAAVAQPALNHRLEDTRDGDLVELCPSAPAIVAPIAERIATQGGAALIVDYGDWRSLGDTFQALQNHQATDPFADPGQADLTAHVDFEALALAASGGGCAHTRLTPQGVFLERLGITPRAQQLADRLTGTERDLLVSAHRRLTHPDEMGNLFKVLGLFPTSANPPPGLER
ncbi:class I SAM-dependent methyltransferase [Ruegeria sp. PrR005]|uniref:Class I SAM-dependent methyltransferase n=1 Tax=Ruegeria sp. PrR005 TaxID=2706882 RepID=A0A6B2NUZ5_9RHOB|nr:SAM-dependent methyltransferase [Ruegeria sp. PrR005]NDW47982.1 class I SAM-dependent methyltransferase [Ruegeria sp. PrR005]